MVYISKFHRFLIFKCYFYHDHVPFLGLDLGLFLLNLHLKILRLTNTNQLTLLQLGAKQPTWY